MSDRIKLTVEMDVTVPQALALKAMFMYWNQLASMGGTREVAFYVDGDGNFKPNCKVTTDQEIPELTDEMRTKAIIHDTSGDRVYDYDPIAWMLHEEK